MARPHPERTAACRTISTTGSYPGNQQQGVLRMSDDYRRDLEVIAKLDDHQFAVTQLGVTEPAFENEFWDKHNAGIYVDIVSGEPLFASTKKYDSGCGWPSFTTPLEPANVVENTDTSHWMV